MRLGPEAQTPPISGIEKTRAWFGTVIPSGGAYLKRRRILILRLTLLKMW